jgi:chromosome segregation ATPase
MATVKQLQVKQTKVAQRVDRLQAELVKAQSELEALNAQLVGQLLVEQNLTMADLVERLSDADEAANQVKPPEWDSEKIDELDQGLGGDHDGIA